MKTDLIKISLRQNAFFIPAEWKSDFSNKKINETTSVFVANCAKLGFSFSEELLHAINGISPLQKIELLDVLREVTGVKKNWTPLVKQWDNPTGESIFDHVKTLFANVFQTENGTRLACGHLIPENSFPLERYNGCPLCGTPFEFEKLEWEGGKSKFKILELWSEKDVEKYMATLLKSPVALDATQAESLKVLLANFELTDGAEIGIKETLMLVIDELVAQGKVDQAGSFFKSPTDVLRYLWYKHTGFLQIVEPKTIIARVSKNSRNWHALLDGSKAAKLKAAANLKLKFSRTESKIYAKWLNDLEMSVAKQCEAMHPKRGIWVRVIRALRLAEYSKRKGFGKLQNLLDVFYKKEYDVWQGRVNSFKLKNDEANAFKLLKQRPGLFARSLFSSMLWFGKDTTVGHFKEIIAKVPPRLVFTLNMYAENYFDKNASRSVKPLGGINKKIPGNKLLTLYSEKDLNEMQNAVKELTLLSIQTKMSAQKNDHKTMFIAPELFNIPIAIGDRSETIQDLPEVLPGTRFPIEGDTVRLFLQWGEGLPAQHLDMDLSCNVAYRNKSERCSYSRLVIPGCKHSGDIQQIPEKTGTAEYIEIDVNQLAKRGAKTVTFTCNAYTNGSLAPNLVVGWMNSEHPMKISSKGVAYDPTAVQHQVRIKQSLTKGMVFGVLDVAKREIVWLEMAFGGQVVPNMSQSAMEALLRKLDAKLKIGDLLQLKAACQNLSIVNNPSLADEIYDIKWAFNSAAVSQLFLGNEN